MKKFAKMSLVAAVAVAGFAGTASAKDLTEAIKGVDVSGTMLYRYNDYNTDNGGLNTTDNYYKLVVNTKAPINDDFQANTRISVNDGFAALDTGANSNDNAAFELELIHANFSYTGLKNTTIIAGKQGLTTPWTKATDSDGTVQFGNGILALSTWKPVTIAAAYFNQTNLDVVNNSGLSFGGGEDIATIGLMGNVGPVALDAWYLDLDDGKDAAGVGFDSYTIGATYKGEIDGIKVGAYGRLTELDLDANNNDYGLWKVGANVGVGIFAAKVSYGETEKSGVGALENSAQTAMEGWNTKLNAQADADYLQATVSAQVLPTVNVALNHFEVDSDTVADREEETYVQITYKPSKNFYAYVRLGELETDDTQDSDVGRLQVQYSF